MNSYGQGEYSQNYDQNTGLDFLPDSAFINLALYKNVSSGDISRGTSSAMAP